MKRGLIFVLSYAVLYVSLSYMLEKFDLTQWAITLAVVIVLALIAIVDYYWLGGKLIRRSYTSGKK